MTETAEDVRSVRSDSSSDDGDFHLFYHMLRWHHPHHHHHGHHHHHHHNSHPHGPNGHPHPLPHGPPVPLPPNPHHHSFLYDLFHHHHSQQQQHNETQKHGLGHTALPTSETTRSTEGDIELGEYKEREKDKDDPLDHLPHDGVEAHHECTTEHKIFAGVLVTICGVIAIFLFSFN